MSAAWAILRKELRIYFVSPLAYVFLAVFLFLAGVFFYLGITLTGEASLRVMLGNLSITLLFVLPMLTMRHFAEEQRSGTFELLMTAPVQPWAIILGKWAASLVLCAVMLAGTLLFTAVLAYYGDPDWGVVCTSYMALLLCAAAFSAAGIFASSLTRDQVAAGLAGIIILLPFWLIGQAAALTDIGWLQTVMKQAAFLTHLHSFTQGVVDSADLLYFAAFIFIFLFLTFRTLESRRWR
ncbi:MAG: ABC transporter permease [Pseudomonadota bacterium]